MSRRGFTLLEITIAIFIFTLSLAAIASMFVFFFNSYSFNFKQNLTLSGVKLAMTKITSELRETRVSEIGSYPLIQLDDDEIEFYSNIDDDSRVEKVRFYLEGNNFYRGVAEPDDSQNPYQGAEERTSISDQVVNSNQPLFTYYNGQWPADTTNNPLIESDRLLNTRLIEINLHLNASPGTQKDLIISTKVHLRNLKTE